MQRYTTNLYFQELTPFSGCSREAFMNLVFLCVFFPIVNVEMVPLAKAYEFLTPLPKMVYSYK